MRLYSGILFLWVLVWGQMGFAESVQPKKYGVESGVVLYRYEGAQRGEEFLYFDDWGMREAKFIRLEQTVHGVDVKKQQALYFLGNEIYSVDFNAKKVRKIHNTPLEYDQNQSTDGDLFRLQEERYLSEGQLKLGQEEVLGRKCQVYAKMQEGFSQCVWKGVLLQQRYGTWFGKGEKEAVWIVENVKPNENKFSIPSSFDQEDGPMIDKNGQIVAAPTPVEEKP